MKKTIVAALAALALIASCAPAKPAAPAAAPVKKIQVACDTTFPPMEYLAEDKSIAGFDIDMFNAVAQAAGFEVEYRSVSWDGIFEGLKVGTYDAVVSSVTITPERQEKMDFSEPYVNAGQILVVPIGSQITKLTELVGKKLGAQVNTTGSMEAEKVKGITIKAYDDIALSFDDMANGRVEAVIIDTPVAVNYVKNNEKYKGKFMMVGEPMTSEFYGVAVAKGNKELLAKINTGLAAIRANGKLDELITKWLK